MADNKKKDDRTDTEIRAQEDAHARREDTVQTDPPLPSEMAAGEPEVHREPSGAIDGRTVPNAQPVPPKQPVVRKQLPEEEVPGA